MSQPILTEAEERYLRDLEKMPSSMRSRIVGWALELIPSIGLFVYGMMSGRRTFMVLGFLSLLYFSVWRMYGQLRGSRIIQSVYKKRLSTGSVDDS